MAGNRLALVAQEPCRAGAASRLVTRILQQPPLLCSFGTIREHLGRDTDGLLLVLVATPADCEPTTRLIQEIYLRKLPPVVLLLVSGKNLESRLADLDPYLFKRLRWPNEAAALAALKEVGERAHEFTGT